MTLRGDLIEIIRSEYDSCRGALHTVDKASKTLDTILDHHTDETLLWNYQATQKRVESGETCLSTEHQLAVLIDPPEET